jgi:hypothetical protein
VGTPLRRLDSQGRRLLRLEAAPCRLRPDRASRRVARRDGASARVEPRRRPLAACTRAEVPARDGNARQGLRRRPRVRRVRGAGALPIIPLRKTPAVKRGDHRASECEHGTWTFAGADAKRNATKWRCPTGDGKVARVDSDVLPVLGKLVAERSRDAVKARVQERLIARAASPRSDSRRTRSACLPTPHGAPRARRSAVPCAWGARRAT